MPRSRHLLLLATAALALGACGGSGDSSADEQEITDAIVVSVTTTVPSNCTELETQRFVEQVEFEKGEAAIESCKSSDESNATDAKVTDINVDGEKASAEATITGSSFDGQSLKISLVKEDGRWKLDHLEEFTDFDRDAFLAAFEKSLSTGNDPSTPEQSKCIVEALQSESDEELEKLFLGGDQNQLVAVLGACFGA